MIPPMPLPRRRSQLNAWPLSNDDLDPNSLIASSMLPTQPPRSCYHSSAWPLLIDDFDLCFPIAPLTLPIQPPRSCYHPNAWPDLCFPIALLTLPIQPPRCCYHATAYPMALSREEPATAASSGTAGLGCCEPVARSSELPYSSSAIDATMPGPHPTASPGPLPATFGQNPRPRRICHPTCRPRMLARRMISSGIAAADSCR